MSIFSVFHPFDSIRDGLRDLNNGLVNQIEESIIHPPRISGSTLLSNYYESSRELARSLAYASLFLAILIAALLFHKIDRVGKALVVFLIVIFLSPSWLWIVDQMVNAGSDFAEAVRFYTPAKDHGFPNISNVYGAIAAFFCSLVFGGGLAFTMGQFDLLVVVFKFWGPIAYSIGAFGKRSKQFSNLVLSIGLVVTLFGRAFAVFFIEMGQLAIDTLPFGKTIFGAVVYTVGSYGLATLSQLALVFACYKGLTAIEGKVSALARGGVNSIVKNVAKVDIRRIMKNHAAGIRPVPVVIRGPKETTVQMGKHAAKRHIANKAVDILAPIGAVQVAKVATKFGGAFAGSKGFKGSKGPRAPTAPTAPTSTAPPPRPPTGGASGGPKLPWKE